MIALDTSFIVSYYNVRDENHDKAMRIMNDLDRGAYGKAFITDYIFDECVTVALARLKSLEKAADVGDDLVRVAGLLRVDQSIFEESRKIFRSQKGTLLSFTDCTTLALMRSSGIETVATFDDDFRKIKDIKVVG